MADNRAEPPEDFDLPGAIRGLATQLGGVASTQREQGSAIAELRTDFETFKKQVTGSNPPPAGGPSITSIAHRARSDSQAALEKVDDFEGRVLRELGLQTRELGDQTAALVALRSETKKQSTALGIGVQGFQWLRTREGKSFAAALAALIFALATLIGGAHSVATVAPPLPDPSGSR